MIEMRPSSSFQIEINYRLDFLEYLIDEILDDLFALRLELEAAEMPESSPSSVFDPMQTIGKYWW